MPIPPPLKFRLTILGILFVVIPVTVEFGSFGAIYFQVDRLEQALRENEREKLVISKISQIMCSLTSNSASAVSTTSQNMRPIHFRQGQKNVLSTELEELDRLVEFDSNQSRRVKELEARIASFLRHVETIKHALATREVLEAARMREEERAVSAMIVNDTESIKSLQSTIQADYESEKETYTNILRSSIIGGFLLNVILIIAALFLFYRQAGQK